MKEMLRRDWRFICLVAILQTLHFSDLKAQSLSVSTEQLVAQSDIVVVGKVNSLKAEWNVDRSRIQTRIIVAVDEHVKGTSRQSSVTFVVPGGEVDGVGELYSHAPTFKPDEAVVLFGKADQQGSYRVSGGSQGKFTVQKDERSGAALIAGKKTLAEFISTVKNAMQVQNLK